MNNNISCENEIILFTSESDGIRLDAYVSQMCELTRSNAAKLVEKGNVCVDGKIVTKKSFPTKCGQNISVTLPPVEVCSAVPQQMDLDIVYEDDDIIIVNKPQGMVVHPAPGNPDKTLVNGLMYHCDGNPSSAV